MFYPGIISLTIIANIGYIFSKFCQHKNGRQAVSNSRLPHLKFHTLPIAIVLSVLFFSFPTLAFGQTIKAKVNTIIDKLPIEKQEKMRPFDKVIKSYIEGVNWFLDDDAVPLEVTLQMFLTDIPSNIEDRYLCELLISSTDVQYFDKRFRFPYQPGAQLVYSEQAVDPLTGVINFYMNMILGNELDKYSGFGGDAYYKRAQSIAALGKFVRTEFVRGWPEREELIKRVFEEPFITFRKMKDFYFYGLYVREKSLADARKNIKIALDMLETVIEKKGDLEEPRQFLNAHYLEFIDIFKDYENKNEVFKKLIKLDYNHKEIYEEHISDS